MLDARRAGVHGEAVVPQLGRRGRIRLRVDGDHLVAGGAQGASSGDAGPRQPDHEIRAWRQRRSRLHAIDD
jgi:hypothetical protein